MSPWVLPGYAEERQLGRGASGRVVSAVHEASGRQVAIKYLAPKLFRDPNFLAGFRAEADLLRSLDVPQVVQLFDYVEEPGQGAAIVMELVNGVSLHEMISRRGATSPESALVVLKGSLLGLAAAHALGIVHRDYKPENVLVDADGNSKLSDFGVAVKEGRRVPSAGTPLYMAPEQWEGAPASPATDIYAAAAVFFECLTSKTPFSGRLGQLQQQHESAAVPLDQVDEPLRGLITRGMAKNPADRPRDAMAFVTELESTAAAAYGPAWEERGRSQLKERAAALLLLLLAASIGGGTGGAVVGTWLASHKNAVLAGAAVAVAVVVGGAVTAVALSGGGTSTPKPLTEKIRQVAGPPATFKAMVTAMPPVVSSSCATPTTFTYSANLTASDAGSVSYRWVYSSGKTGPVQTLRFTAPGTQPVTGGSVQAKAAGTGWAAIEMASPAEVISNKATYRLLCTKPGAVTASATVTPATRQVACGSAPPGFTFTGLISSPKAGSVTYHWALSDGATSPPATLTFTGAGTQAVQPLTVTPPADTANSAAMLVVTSPGTSVSNTASYSLTCTTGVTTPPPALAITGSLPAGQEGSTYSATLSATGGDGRYTWSSSDLPGGLSISSSGAISGRPSAAGTFPVTVTVTDGESPARTASATYSLTIGYPKLTIATSTLPDGSYLGSNPDYSATLNATGGDGTYGWTATGLPGGLSISTSGVISGMPAKPGTFTVTVTVTDGESPAQTASMTYTLTINNEG